MPGTTSPGVDSHAHLDMLDDPAGALERAARAGVRLVLTVVDLAESSEAWLNELPLLLDATRERLRAAGSEAEPPEVRVVVGMHPHNASEWTPEVGTRMLGLARRPEVVAFGEIGLDFHYDNSPREQQVRMFRDHLRLAHEADVPVIVHLREAHDSGLQIMREEGVPRAGAVLHCFTEGPEWAERFLELGCHVSFSGLVTFKKADAIRRAVSVVPLDRLLVETDAPFLAPEPYRGRTNEPALVTLTAARVAEVLGMSAEDIAATAHRNARRLFRLDESPGSSGGPS